MSPYKLLFTVLLILVCSCKREGIIIDKNASEEERLYFEDYEPPQYKWGFLNQHGKLIIEGIYDAARDFSEGLAAVNFKGKWGYINYNGEVIIPFRYRSAGAFSCNRALVQDFEYRQFYIDQDGSKVFEIQAPTLTTYADCIARVIKNGYQYFIDKNGEIIGDSTYLSASNFSDGYAVVEDMEGFNVIDDEGEKILNQSYDKCYLPSDMKVRVKEEGMIKYISIPDGSISDGYSDGTDYHTGVAAIEMGAWKLINKNGKIMSKGYDQLNYIGEGRWIYYQNGKCGLLNNEGKEITRAIYDIIYRFNDGVTAYSMGDLWGILDIQGKETTPAIFPLLWEFKNGMARAIFNGGVGFINGRGEQLIPPAYIEVKDFSEGMARVQVLK